MGANKAEFVNFSEATSGSPVKVDRENGIIRGVSLLGPESTNTKFPSARVRKYPASVRRNRAAKFNGLPVNFDHSKEKNSNRRFIEQVGKVHNATFDEGSDRNRGDLVLKKAHPHYELLMESAEKFPETFGLSIIGGGPVRLDGDVELVEDITVLRSVDVVTEPATVASLFEERRPMTKLKELFSELSKVDATKAAASRGLAVFTEDLAIASDLSEMTEAQKLAAGFEVARNAVFAESIDKAEKLKKIQVLLDAEDGAETKLEEQKKPTEGANVLLAQVNRLAELVEAQQRRELVKDVCFEEQVDLSAATSAVRQQLEKAKTRQEVLDIVKVLPPAGRPAQFKSSTAIFSESRSSEKETAETLTAYRRKSK